MNKNEIALILEKMDKNVIKMDIDINPKKVKRLNRLFINNDHLIAITAFVMKDADRDFEVV